MYSYSIYLISHFLKLFINNLNDLFKKGENMFNQFINFKLLNNNGF